MVHKHLEIRLRYKNQWFYFGNPFKILTAYQQKDVIEVLTQADDEILAGRHIAGFISYEASAGIDSALITQKDSSFPLIVLGVFENMNVENAFPTNVLKYKIGQWEPSVQAFEYYKNINKIKNYIAAGDTYQVNYTMRLRTTFEGDTQSFFNKLLQNQNAPFAAYLEVDNFSVCSISPELFFDLDDNDLLSRPMKGTAARGLSYKQDIKNSIALQESAKEKAENLMIVDMIRNDMGKIAEPGSVKVENLFKVTRYPTVWQMTSDVKCKTNADFKEIISALFPCASITGAPKTSTMRIISELENYPRGIYTGAIGFFTSDRKAQFNVAIRTVLIDRVKNTAEYGVGGGIVWDSIDKNEYAECVLKAKVLRHQEPSFKILETVLYNPKEGIFLKNYHQNRMQQSAEYFGFTFDRIKFEEKLASIVYKNSALKIRILLSKNGDIDLEQKELRDPESDRVLNINLAKQPINQDDYFLYHKTTNRAVYQAAENEIRRGQLDDVILWNKRNEITEATIYNVVLKIGGNLFTPKLECGLLAGTFRQYLLDLNKVKEKVLYKDDIINADEIFLINSVQKWRRAKLLF